MRRTWVLVGAALALVGLALVIVLIQSKPRLAGTNDVRAAALVATVPGGAAVCQGPTTLPDDAAALQLTVGTDGLPGPPLIARVDVSGRAVTMGRRSGGYRQGPVRIPLRPITAETVGAMVCVRNAGTRPITVGGSPAPPASAAQVGGRPQLGAITLEYLRPGSQSWLSLAPTVAERFGYGKGSVWSGWTLALAAALLVAVWVAAIGLVVRGARRQPPLPGRGSAT